MGISFKFIIAKCVEITTRPVLFHMECLYIGHFILMQFFKTEVCHFILKFSLLAQQNMQRQNKPSVCWFHLWLDQNTALFVGESQPIPASLGRGYDVMQHWQWSSNRKHCFTFVCSITHMCFSLYEDLYGLFCKAVNLNSSSVIPICVHVLLYPWFYKRKSTHFGWQ